MNTVQVNLVEHDVALSYDMPCPVETTLKVIGGRWKALILFHLKDETRRFNELRRLIPSVTQRMLTAHLRELEHDGVITRKVYPVVPPRVEYSLSELGQSLTPILTAMAVWGEQYSVPVNEPKPTAE
jgi:DNA-binding HxlR family transcriptional regulator